MTWLAILAVGAGSFLFRVAPLLLLEHRELGPRSERFIRHAGLAAVTALVGTSTAHSADGGHVLPTLIAVAVALAATLRGRSMVRTVVAGGAAFAFVLLGLRLLAG